MMKSDDNRRRRWRFHVPGDVREARRIQEKLRGELVIEGDPAPETVRTIAGVDASITRFEKRMIGAVVLLSWPEMKVLESRTAVMEATFPYIPHYLSFREIPVLLKAAEQLTVNPDLVIVDGQGYAHTRRMGLASHLGLVTGWATIGAAKSPLVGECAEPLAEKGSWCECRDRGEKVGHILRTRTGVKPLWVSPGNGIGFDAARDWVLRATTRYRLPEPTRLAHHTASAERRKQ